MIQNCNTHADELTSMLNDQGYSQEVIDASAKLSQMIAEYDKENPEDVPSVRVAKDNYPDEEDDSAEGKTDSPEEDKAETSDPEEVDPKEMRDMPLAEHKAMLKKKKIITIQID